MGTRQEAGGGKLHVFVAALSKAGAGALRFRRAEGGGGAEPLAIMAPDGKFYTKLAVEAADHQVGTRLISIWHFRLLSGYWAQAGIGWCC